MESDSVPFFLKNVFEEFAELFCKVKNICAGLHGRHPTKCRKEEKNVTDMTNVVKEITNRR